jgi:hypothetical protein
MYRAMLDLGYAYWSALGNVLGMGVNGAGLGRCPSCGHDVAVCSCWCSRCRRRWDCCICGSEAPAWYRARPECATSRSHRVQTASCWSDPRIEIVQRNRACRVATYVPAGWWEEDLIVDSWTPAPNGDVSLDIQKHSGYQPAVVKVEVADTARTQSYLVRLLIRGMPESAQENAAIHIQVTGAAAEGSGQSSRPGPEDHSKPKS